MLQSILHKLDYTCSKLPIIWSNDIRVTYLSVNTIFHTRTKHIKVDIHFMHDKVIKKKI